MASRTQDELMQIVRNGGGLDIRAQNHSTQDLIDLARNMKGKARIILRDIDGKTSDELVQICRNSVGSVVFVIE